MAAVNSDLQNGLTIVVGVTALRLSLTDVYLRYVKESLRPWLVIAGVLLVLVGVTGLVRDARRASAATAEEPEAEPVGAGHEHDHDDHMPRVAWLLMLPVLAIFLISPASLGAFAARRSSNARLEAPKAKFPDLAAEVRGAVPMTLREYSLRSYYDDTKSLATTRVRLTGFVTPESGQLMLTRFALSCCAADGVAVKVRLVDFPGPTPSADTWFEVEGEFLEPDRLEGAPITTRPAPMKVVGTPRRISEPKQPYES
jgi:uncharacterized repeat protein (TIGR03943 family)